MKKYCILFILFLSFLTSCSTKGRRSHDNGVAKDSALVIGNPVDAELNNILLFPVGSNYDPDIHKSDRLSSDYKLSIKANSGALNDRYAKTEYINDNENAYDIRNLLFYNQLSGASYPLTNNNLHILSFALHNEFKNPLIIFRVVKQDYNQDSLFNSMDPVMLFVSDLAGKNLTQITPDNEQYIDYFYYPETQNLLLKTIIDSNGDKLFSPSEETNFREMRIASPAMGREIFPASLKDSLRMH